MYLQLEESGEAKEQESKWEDELTTVVDAWRRGSAESEPISTLDRTVCESTKAVDSKEETCRSRPQANERRSTIINTEDSVVDQLRTKEGGAQMTEPIPVDRKSKSRMKHKLLILAWLHARPMTDPCTVVNLKSKTQTKL